MKLKPDFCVKYNFKGSSIGLLAVEVKLPNPHSSQVLSDRSKLGLELKRMVDEQIIQGSYEPKSFGVLVEGFRCTFFGCSLDRSGCYLFVELEKHWLLQSPDDMMLIPDLVVVFMKIKVAIIEVVGKLNKRIKQDKALNASVKPTVGLPTKRASNL
ncbi:hypothetical protein A0J61_11734 [Choanephora cucurbitarum]|uniref:Uncharacterized protein n=1 Tax=Choanephora cucurbitarum TaxID=101091 RepID=A0A1C7MTX9_9FUNG|nr:hypothetical protein A0J61_11734 [Choanephora cucurbitarum]